MKVVLSAWGGSNYQYTFDDDDQVSVRDNFRNVATQSVRVPGMAGAVDVMGNEWVATEAGNVQIYIWVHATNAVSITQRLDALGRLIHAGRFRLTTRTTNGETRHTFGRVSSIDYSENTQDMPHLRQRVQINFQVPRAVWRGGTYGGLRVGEPDLMIDNPAEWEIGQGGYLVEADGVETLATLPYAGNAVSVPAIVLSVPALETCENPIIERLNGSYVVDRVSYDGTLVAGDELTIDGERQIVSLNGINAVQNVDYLHPDFFRVEPDVSAIRIRQGDAGSECNVRFYYYDIYR